MKKIIICLLSLSLLLFGCGKDNGTIEVSLNGNPTTGYAWSYQIDDTSILSCLSDKYIANNQDSDAVGVGGIYKYIFEGQKEGTTTITFKYARSWEDEPVRIKKYIMKVDSDKKVTIINEE